MANGGVLLLCEGLGTSDPRDLTGPIWSQRGRQRGVKGDKEANRGRTAAWSEGDAATRWPTLAHNLGNKGQAWNDTSNELLGNALRPKTTCQKTTARTAILTTSMRGSFRRCIGTLTPTTTTTPQDPTSPSHWGVVGHE